MAHQALEKHLWPKPVQDKLKSHFSHATLLSLGKCTLELGQRKCDNCSKKLVRMPLQSFTSMKLMQWGTGTAEF
jgi:hypothetical protein